MVIGMGYAAVGQAVDFASQVLWCENSDKTYFCGKAFTSISASETSLITKINVSAFFDSPGYDYSDAKQKQIVTWNPTTWKVTVPVTPQYCAHRGDYVVEATHQWFITPGAGPAGSVETLDTEYRYVCDCGPPSY